MESDHIPAIATSLNRGTLLQPKNFKIDTFYFSKSSLSDEVIMDKIKSHNASNQSNKPIKKKLSAEFSFVLTKLTKQSLEDRFRRTSIPLVVEQKETLKQMVTHKEGLGI